MCSTIRNGVRTLINNFEGFWDLFTKIVWPALIAYAAYLHRRLEVQHEALSSLQRLYYEQKAEVNKTFATHESVSQLENKVVSMLNRIDDKVTRILEDKA